MQDLIALIQSLTLPAGATTGARIELDGTLGEIRIYNSAGQLVGKIDSNGIITIFDPVGGSNIKLSPTAPPVILFTPATFGVHTLGTGSIGTDEQTVPDRARLLIDSPSLDGADRAQITLEHATTDIPKVFISDGSAANVGARLEVFGDVEASTAGTGRKGDFLINQRSIARGVMDVVNGTANIGPTVGTTELTIITGNAVTFDGVQRVRVALAIRSISGDTLGDVFGVQIKEDGTQVQQHNWRTEVINVGARGLTVIYASAVAPSAGNHTYSATIQRQAGAGVATVQGAAGRPIQLITEQTGGA